MRSWLQDDEDTESSSTADDMEEEEDEDEVKLAVEPVVDSTGSSNKVFRSSVTLNVNEVSQDSWVWNIISIFIIFFWK